ncbi:MAG TPA: LysR substrate-binding domain-containing protein [Planctomycetota bacterium]|nr:LysR substrate-binding domain-containing protein [Planctomycetota bacterium]
MRPTIAQLEAFLAVARTLNFRRAAAETFTSQSVLSAQVMRLEEILGVRLLERDRRRVILTADGQKVRDHARRVLDAIDELVGATRDAQNVLTGVLRVGLIPTVAPYLVPKMLPAVQRAHPGARLLLREDRTARLVEMVQAAELDVIVLDIDVDLGTLHSTFLFEDAFLLAAPAGHPLAERAEVTVAELEDVDLLLLEDGHCLSDRIRTICRRARDEDGSDFRATSLVTLVHMVAAGAGVTLLPEMAARVYRSLPGLRLVPFQPPAPTRRIGIAWRASDGRLPSFRRLAELIEASA